MNINNNLNNVNSKIENYTLSSGNDKINEEVKNKDLIKTYDISQLKIGDVITAKILSNCDGELYLSFEEDNTFLKACLKQNVQLLCGEECSFVVNNNCDGKLELKFLNKIVQNYDLISKSLEMARLELNEDNAGIVDALIDKGQPINRQNILKYMNLVKQYGIENIRNIIDMKIEGITVSEKNLNMYQKYMDAEYKISENVDRVLEKLSDYIKNVTNSDSFLENKSSVDKMIKELGDIFLSDESNETMQILNKKNEVFLNENSNLEIINKNDENISKNINYVSTESEEVNKDNNIDYDKNNDNKKITNETLLEEKETIVRNFEKIKHNIKEELRINLDFKDKSGIEIKDEVERVYKRINKILEIIDKIVVDEGENKLKESIKETKNNLNFMNELNNADQYIQIPLKMNSQETEANLYVYTRKQKEKEYKDILSAYLHLDMENLGSTDVEVKLKNKNVEMYFIVSNKEAEKLIIENMSELIKALEYKGYSSVVNARTIEKSKDDFKPLYPLTGEEKKIVVKKKNTFDIRT